MNHALKIFAVSVVAVFVAGVAHADIASSGYVNSAINSLRSTVSAENTGKVITSVTQSDGKLTGVTSEYVRVPVGSDSAPTALANVWIQ